MILKKFKFFWNNPSIFSKRDPKFEHFEKSVAFCGVFATFIVFWLNSRFFPGRTHLLLEKQQTLNVLLNRTISVAFYGKLATLSNLKKFTITLGNPIYFFFFLKKIKFWTFWESLLFQSHSTANLLPLAIWKNLQFFFSKSLSFYLERTQFLNVLRNLTISWALNGNFATLSDFEKKIQDFVLKKNASVFV